MRKREQPDPSPDSLSRGYEPDQVRLRGIVVFVVCFVAFAVVAQASLWWLVKGYASRQRLVDVPSSALAGTRPPPAAPSLQPTPHHDVVPAQDLEAMYAKEDAVFARLGWDVNRETHRVEPPDSAVRAVIEQSARRAGNGAGADTRPATQPGPTMEPGGAR